MLDPSTEFNHSCALRKHPAVIPLLPTQACYDPRRLSVKPSPDLPLLPWAIQLLANSKTVTQKIPHWRELIPDLPFLSPLKDDPIELSGNPPRVVPFPLAPSKPTQNQRRWENKKARRDIAKADPSFRIKQAYKSAEKASIQWNKAQKKAEDWFKKYKTYTGLAKNAAYSSYAIQQQIADKKSQEYQKFKTLYESLKKQ